MPSAAALRLEIEHTLERRFPAALTPAQRTINEVAPTGIAVVDELLDGGLPVGAISEVTGPVSSGRTSLVHAFLAQRIRGGQVCAWVDVDDAFDPESAAASGVALRQLLWVRCDKSVVATPARPGKPTGSRPSTKPWTRLDQALRATDLLLAAGGFAAIVLDLGDLETEDARRIPLATWYRFRQAADRARTSVVIVGKASYAQASAAAVLECIPLRPETAGDTVLTGFQYQVRRERQRFTPAAMGKRKAPASTWQAASTWDLERRA